MGLIDKFKNLFTEEVEVEEKPEQKEGVQKEVIQVEIPSPKKSRSEIYANEEPEKSEPVKLEPEEPKKNEYKFPFFDDNDFDSIDVKPEPKEERKVQAHRKEVYNPPKEEKRVFRPSPIISPVYGILDKGYQREETSKHDGRSSYYSSKEANVDAIRNKAYGGLEADIETTLFGGNRVLFNDKEETKQEDIIDKTETKEETPSKVKEDDFSFNASTISEKPRHGVVEEDDLTDLLEEEMDKPVEPVEKPKKEPRKISDKELFSLIDSMYEKGNK